MSKHCRGAAAQEEARRQGGGGGAKNWRRGSLLEWSELRVDERRLRERQGTDQAC